MRVLKTLGEANDALTQPGAVGVMPTDTVYGLVARAADKQAVARLYALKERTNKPGTLIAADIDQLVALGLKRRYLTPVAQYWPNPLSIIIPTELALDYLHVGKLSLAVRIPKDKKLHALLTQTGPLLTSSANLSDQPPATTLQEANAYFGDTVDFYVDGGKIEAEASTVIQIIDDAVAVLREGSIKINEKGEITS